MRRFRIRRLWVRNGPGFAVLGTVAFIAAAAIAARGPGEPVGFDGPVTGIGGVFLRAEDSDRQLAWYRDQLGIERAPGHHGVNFFWRDRGDPGRYGRTVWALFPRDSDYFGDTRQQVMINYRVRDLDALLRDLRASGVEQVGEVEEFPYGRFAWILDGEGNRVELWEPAPGENPAAEEAGLR